MSKQIYHTVGNFPRSNKIVERGKIGAANTQIHITFDIYVFIKLV